MKSKNLWWPFLQEHKLRTGAIILAGLFSSYCTLLLSLSIGKFMEITTGAGMGKTRALHLLGIDLPGSLPIFFSFFFVVLVLKFVSNWAYNCYLQLLGESFAAGLRTSLMYHLIKQKTTDNAAELKTSMLLPFAGDAKTLQRLLTRGVAGFITDMLFLIMAFYVLFSLQPVLTCYVIVMLWFFYGIQRWYNHTNSIVFAEKRKRQASLLNYSATMLARDGNLTLTQHKALDKKSNRLKKILISFHVKNAFLKALTPLMLYLMLAVIMVFISFGTGLGDLPPGTIITYMLLLMTLFPTLRNIIRIENTWVQGNLTAQKYLKAVTTSNTTSSREVRVDPAASTFPLCVQHG